MRRPPLTLALVAALAAPAGGGMVPGYAIDATTTSGYRLVDIDGAKDKYKEDYNLRSGLRLFNLRVDGLADKPDDTPLDRFHLEVDTPGDEPLSTFRLTAADQKLYDLRVNFQRAKYFYAVPQLFEAPVLGDVRTDDLHDFDFVRTNGAVDLTVHAPHLPTLLFGYHLYERDGNAVSTARVAGGDTFLVHAPVNDVTHVGRLGTEFRALGTDVFLQQEYRRIDRHEDLRGPIDPLGLDPTDASTLGSYRSEHDEHLDIPVTTVRLHRTVGDRLDLTGAYLYSHADLSADRTRTLAGAVTPVYPSGRDLLRDHADAALSTHVVDLGSTLQVAEHVRWHSSYRFDERSQSGTLDETSTLGLLAARTGDQVKRHNVTTDVEVEPRADLSLRAGLRWSRRDANLSQSGQDISTDSVGAIGSLRWRPCTYFDLFARYENVQLDDPFLVPGDPAQGIPEREIALTFVNRATTGFHVTPRDWLELSYQFLADSRENQSFDARSQSFGNTVAFTVVPRKDMTVFFSYTRRDVDDHADILIAPTYRPTGSVQRGTEDVLVHELTWDFAALGHKWSSGWNLAFVNTENKLAPRLEVDAASRSFFDLTRVDGAFFLTLHHWLVDPTLEVRRIEYDERVLKRNDYSATIIAFKLTRRWGL